MKNKKEDNKVKKRPKKQNFYLSISNQLKHSTNLTKIQDKLNISKQQLNYYLRELKKKGFIYNRGHGWWELTEKGKNPSKYGIFLEKDSIRGHAYIWEVEIPKKIENWEKRLEILKKKGINYKLVGRGTTPRIKALGRKVWLCNNHLRIFDTEKQSYYGEDAIESRKNGLLQAHRIVSVLENKLGFLFKPCKIKIKKEHYALIKNDLAIDQNNKGIIMRIKDENGEEFLLIDDSLGMGGELETTGKKAFKTNIPLQKWWIENKNDNFKTTSPENIKENFETTKSNLNELSENQVEISNAIKKSSEIQMDSELRLKQMDSRLRGQEELIYQLIEVMKNK